jgi:hypothetical protein
MMAARFPLEPLLRAAGIPSVAEVHEDGRHVNRSGKRVDQPLAGLAALAERLEVSLRMAQFLMSGGREHPAGLSERQADRYAVKLGLLPWEVWPDWWSEAPGEEDLHARPCHCRRADRRPVGDECDRCGGALRPAVSKEGHADAA